MPDQQTEVRLAIVEERQQVVSTQLDAVQTALKSSADTLLQIRLDIADIKRATKTYSPTGNGSYQSPRNGSTGRPNGGGSDLLRNSGLVTAGGVGGILIWQQIVLPLLNLLVR